MTEADAAPIFPLPLLGFSAWSGTGKTTLLAQLIPLLKAKGLRIGLVKHAHHTFDIDHPGKDSHTLRKAGATQVVVASKHLIAAMLETPHRESEPSLQDALNSIQANQLDLILVEGFKAASIPKIELHREVLNKPYLYPDDEHIIALADDTEKALTQTLSNDVAHLDLNQPELITAFIVNWLKQQS